jgi:hypothetical protein
MPGAIELGRAGETGRARADDGDPLAGAAHGRLCDHPSLRKATIDDGGLDGLDRDGWGADAEHAGTFAGRRTDASGDLRKVVGPVESTESILPAPVIHEIVPLGDEVVDRAAGGHAGELRPGVAEGDATVHAAGALLLELLGGEVLVELVPILETLRGAALCRYLAGELEKSGGLAHLTYLRCGMDPGR